MEHAAAVWWATLPDGVRVAVPDDLRVMTRWVLEEQGDWFEDELRFVRRWFPEGGVAIDVGANYGCFTLSLAKRGGPSGRVIAFEPAAATAELLERSVAANGFGQVQVVRSAVADRVGTAWLRHRRSSELHELGERSDGDSGGETVPITSLDGRWASEGLKRLDFVKIDAEGSEVAVLRGASRLLEATSPLLMTELIHSSQLNVGLREALRALGFDVYRLVPGLMALVPFDDSREIDPFQMNLFACRGDRALALHESGHLAGPGGPDPPSADRDALGDWLAAHGELPSSPDWTAVPDSLIEAMAEFSLAMEPERSMAERWSRLRRAHERTRELASEEPGVQASLAMIASALGSRGEANRHLAEALQALQRRRDWNRRIPSLLRGVRPRGSDPDPESFRIAILEAFERSRAWSSHFAGLSDERALRLWAALGRLSPDIVRRLDLESRVRRG